MKPLHCLYLIVVLVLSTFALVTVVTAQGPMGTAFTYQGYLKSGASAYTGTCDFQFGLFNALTLGSQIGVTRTVPSVSVAGGLFTAPIDFGVGAFDGDARYLNIAVRCPAGSGAYTSLTSRQALAPAPYALFAQQTEGYQNVVVVAKSGGDYSTISAALASITTASSTNPFLIKVMPGVYAEQVAMKPWVDIEGAGEDATKITSVGNTYSYSATVNGANNAELRFLTVENTGGSTHAIAIFGPNSASLRLSHVTAAASGGTQYTYGIENFSSLLMRDTTVKASGPASVWGVSTDYYPVTMTNVSVTASGGNSMGIANGYSSRLTMMNVIVTTSGATYNEGVLNSSSVTIMDSIVTSNGGDQNYAVSNSSSMTMTNVIATASGGTNSWGLFNGGSLTLTNVTLSATGGSSYNFGVENRDAPSSLIHNSTISASGGPHSYGIDNDAMSGFGPYTVTVDNSQIRGTTNTIFTNSYFTTMVGASKLDGGPVSGTVKCAAVYDENYGFYSTTCP